MSSPAPAYPAPRRPVGLILAAIVLALMTCYGLLSGAAIVFLAFAMRATQAPQVPMVTVIQVALGVISLLISGFCAATVVGLFRIQRWARYSMLILGGLLAIFSALFALGFVAFAFSPFLTNAPAAAPNAPPLNPAMMKLILLGMGGFFLAVSLIGIWWLVYFNLRRIRALFDPKHYPAPEGPVPLDPEHPMPAPTPQKNTSVVEVLVICLAVLYLFGAASATGMALLHLPLFLLGIIIRGPAALAFSLSFAAFSLAIGVGLLRRNKLGWNLAFAFQIFGVVSSLFLVLPVSRAAMAQYQQEISQSMSTRFGLPTTPANLSLQGSTMYLLSGVFTIVFAAAVIWLLLRARPYFDFRKSV